MRRTPLRIVECQHCGERLVLAGGPTNPAYVRHLVERHGSADVRGQRPPTLSQTTAS